MHAKWVCKDFEIKHLGKYHDLYVQSDYVIIVSWCIWKFSKNMAWNIWTLPHSFSLDPGLALQAALKKTKVKSDILTDMLLMIIND